LCIVLDNIFTKIVYNLWSYGMSQKKNAHVSKGNDGSFYFVKNGIYLFLTKYEEETILCRSFVQSHTHAKVLTQVKD